MTETGESFRLNLRFRKSEYLDLLEDLKSYKTPESESGRARYLMRMGLEAERAGFNQNGISAVAATGGEKPQPDAKRNGAPPAAEAPKPSKSAVDEQLDSMIARGFDITKFQFPGMSRA